MNLFQRFCAYLQLFAAVQSAEHQHSLTGQRFYVVPQMNTDGSRKLIVMCRKDFRGLKRKHYIDENANHRVLLTDSVYFTAANRNGDGFLSERDRKAKAVQYFSWVDACINSQRRRRKKKRN